MSVDGGSEHHRVSLQGRRSFSLRKVASGVDFSIPIVLEDENKGAKPPIVPSVVRGVCDELQDRITSRRLSIMPSTLNTLFNNVDELSRDILRSSDVDSMLRILKTEFKGVSKQASIQRLADCSPFQTSTILRSFFRYIELCDAGIALSIDFPNAGFTIIGPPLSDDGEKLDVTRYMRTVEHYLGEKCISEPIRRDIFCFVMLFLSNMFEIVNYGYRQDPAICSLTRFSIANRFAPVLVNLQCVACDEEIRDPSSGCNQCKLIRASLKPPYAVQVIDTMLMYIPVQFWRGTLNSPRTTSLTRRNTSIAHNEIINYLKNKLNTDESFEQTTLDKGNLKIGALKGDIEQPTKTPSSLNTDYNSSPQVTSDTSGEQTTSIIDHGTTGNTVTTGTIGGTGLSGTTSRTETGDSSEAAFTESSYVTDSAKNLSTSLHLQAKGEVSHKLTKKKSSKKSVKSRKSGKKSKRTSKQKSWKRKSKKTKSKHIARKKSKPKKSKLKKGRKSKKSKPKISRKKTKIKGKKMAKRKSKTRKGR